MGIVRKAQALADVVRTGTVPAADCTSTRPTDSQTRELCNFFFFNLPWICDGSRRTYTGRKVASSKTKQFLSIVNKFASVITTVVCARCDFTNQQAGLVTNAALSELETISNHGSDL